MYIINNGKCKITYFDVQVELGLIVMFIFFVLYKICGTCREVSFWAYRVTIDKQTINRIASTVQDKQRIAGKIAYTCVIVAIVGDK